MGKASRVKRRAVQREVKGGRGNVWWYAAAAFVVVLGTVAIVVSRGGDEAEAGPKANEDHWHAALGVNVCGQWAQNAPEFHERAGTQLGAGIHSHGDGLIHIHPYVSDESGGRATLGRYLEFGGWQVTENSLQFWEGTHTSGEKCGEEEAVIRWSVNGEERDGNPADYLPADQDVIVIALLPEGAEIGDPPQKDSLANPQDLEPTDTTAVTIPIESAPGSTAPGETAPGATAPPGPADTTVPPATG